MKCSILNQTNNDLEEISLKSELFLLDIDDNKRANGENKVCN